MIYTGNKGRRPKGRICRIWIGILCGFVFLSCERRKSIPYDFPEYEPVLVVHGAVSPQSGGVVLVRYSRPIGGIPGMAPDLPRLEVYLSDEDGRSFPFVLDTILYSENKPRQNIQTAQFYIHPDSLDLHQETSYRLHVADKDGDITHVSSAVLLPPKPEPRDVELYCEPGVSLDCRLSLFLDPVSEPVSAIGIRYHEKDTLQEEITDIPGLAGRLFPEIQWPESDIWAESLAFETRVRLYPQGTTIHLSYLSEDLARVMKEMAENFRLGEDIFALLQPYHSNFKNIQGVFGLYNEVLREVKP